MTAINPFRARVNPAAPDRTILLVLLFLVTSAILLVAHNTDMLSQMGLLGVVLKNPIIEAFVVSLFLANVLFAYLWRAAPWAKLLVGLGSLLVVLPLAGRADTSLLDLSIQIMIFAALALGLNIVVGLAGLLDLGYVAFFAVGAYVWGFLPAHALPRSFVTSAKTRAPMPSAPCCWVWQPLWRGWEATWRSRSAGQTAHQAAQPGPWPWPWWPASWRGFSWAAVFSRSASAAGPCRRCGSPCFR
ncbi:hypothetical protein ACFSC4_04670 [Deinococcus malanensis]|uniref:ABC transporter permease subunit n=1 Tax=Deinococcus malanensis TaxID=1706855 RepID=UPI003639667E